MALDKNSKTFVVYIATLEARLLKITTHSLQKVQITVLKQNKASTKVPSKYFNFVEVFSKEKVLMLLEQTNLNKHAIKLKNNK